MHFKTNYIYTTLCILLFHIFSSLSAQNIEYIPFKTSSQVTPETINLTPDYYVGSINGQAGSSGSGTASYTVPIELPQGTGGMHPNISLMYSSGSSNKSILGKGWHFIGLSSISRASKTTFHDGELDPVRFDNTDRFVLDGQRLFPLNNNGIDGTTYKTEKENQALITSHGDENGAPSSFTVETKDGITHVYGGESNAKVSNFEGTLFSWHISASYDKFGNHIRYVYEEVDGEHRIQSILYNGTSADPRTNVRFHYKIREDKNFGFTHFKQFNSNSLLDKIEVYYGEGMYSNPNWASLKAHTYEFKYSKDDRDSYLSELHKISGDGLLKYNPTVFYYGKFDVAPLITESSLQLTDPVLGNHQDYLVGDFNGDGLSDIARLEVKPTNWNIPSGVSYANQNTYKGFTVSINNGDGNSYTDLPRVGFLNTGQSSFSGTTISASNRITFRTGDFDGDGKQEILVAEFESHYAPNKIYSYSIFDIQGNTITESAHSFAITGENFAKLNENFNLQGNQETRHLYTFNSTLVTGDFDGDQSTDIIINYHYESDTKNRTWFHNPRKNYVRELKTDNGFGVADYLLVKDYSRPPSLMSYDVDKDGDAELIAIYDSVDVPLITNNIELTMTGEQNNVIVNNHPQTFVTAYDIKENMHEPTAYVSDGTILFNSGYPSYFLDVDDSPSHSMGSFFDFVSTLIDLFAAPVINLSSDLSPGLPPANSVEALEYIYNHLFNAEPYRGIKNLRCSDFNGDGIMDIKFESETAANTSHYIVYGTTTKIDFNDPYRANIWHHHITELDFNITAGNAQYHRILPFDYNTDGLTDFLEFDLSGAGGEEGPTRMTLHYNKGRGEFGQYEHINSSWNRGYVKTLAGQGIHWNIYPGHFNRDSKLDLLFDLPVNYSNGFDYSDNEHLLFIKQKSNLADDLHRLVTVRNGQGNVTHFDYKMMSDPSIYRRGTTAIYPFSDFQANTPVLSAIKKDNGIGGYLTTAFTYESATVHRQGRGALGYDRVETIMPELNTRQVSWSQLLSAPVVKVPHLTEVYNTSGSSDVLISRSETKYHTPTYHSVLYTYSSHNHKSFRYNVESTISANYLEGGVSKSEYTFDDYDNILTTIQKVYNKATFSSGTFSLNSTDLIQTSEVVNTYDQYNTWIPASIKQSVASVNYLGGVASPNTSTTTRYKYYSTGLPEYIYYYDGTSKSYYDYFTYYTNGLLKTSKTSGGGIDKNAMTYEYDGFQRVSKEVNAEGHQTITEYYDIGASGGQAKLVTLPSGLSGQIIYNSFGHPIRQIDERGNSIYTSSAWITDPTLANNLNALYQIKTEKDGDATQVLILDRLGRTVRSKTESFDNQEIIIDTEYNSIGQKDRESEPYIIGQALPIHFTAFRYDNFNRNIQSIRFSTSTGSDPYSYLKATTTLALPAPAPNATHRSISVTAPDGRIKTTYTDFTGRALEVIENGTSVQHRYYTSGRLESSKIFTPNQSIGGNYDQTMVEYTYDIQGNLIEQDDNSIGHEVYTYNKYGELVGEVNAAGQSTSYTYDQLGRPRTRVTPEGQTIYEYWSSSNITPVGAVLPGIGLIKSSTLNVLGSPKHVVSYTYNNYNDVSQVTENFDGETPVTKSFSYNTYGDINQKVFHTGFTLNYDYQSNGELHRIFSPSIESGFSVELLKIERKDAYGHITKYTRGGTSALTTNHVYNERVGLIKSTVGSLHDINYNFNHQSGNLRAKEDVLASKVERYAYDNFDRLESTQVETAYTEFYPDGSYMNFGSQEPEIDVNFHESENLNINSKSLVAQSITYDPTSVNQIAGVTTASGVPNALQLGDILNSENTSFHKPSRLKMAVNGEFHEVNFEFGVDQDRKRALIKHNDVLTKKRLYYDEYEELYTYNSSGGVEDVYRMHNVGIGNGLEFVYTTKNGLTDGWNNMFFTITDYQGSVLKVTDRNGNVVDNKEYNYDAWGRRRDKDSWTYDGSSTDAVPTGGVDADGNPWTADEYENPGETVAPPAPPATSTIGTEWFNRGYTGHEHFDDFQMIHMNARLYNPFLGTFLSPDRVIADPSNSQNYNRYSYALGNPTKYTDPSGYMPGLSSASRGAMLLASAFYGGDITGVSFGGNYSTNSGTNSQNLGNQFNNISTDNKKNPPETSAQGGMLDEITLKPDGSAYFTGDVSYFEYAFNGVESPYATLGDYNEAMGTDFTDHSEAMMWHDQTFYRDPALKELKSRIYKSTGEAAAVIAEAGSYAIGGEVILIKGVGLLYKLYKASKVAKAVSTGLKASKLANKLSQSRKVVQKVVEKTVSKSKGLTNSQLVQKSATLAERAIGGTGRFAGTAKHTYATNLLKRYQKIHGNRGLKVNHYFNNNATLGAGNRGFLDVIDKTNGVIYDFKFGKATWGRGQFEKYSRNFLDYTLEIVRP